MRMIDRFDLYMRQRGLNDNLVSVQLGLSNGVIGKSRKPGRDLSRRVLELIENYYADLNIDWVKTGDGEMLKPPQEAPVLPRGGNVLNGDIVKVFLNMSETISRQEANISKLADMVDRLTGGQASTPKNGTA